MFIIERNIDKVHRMSSANYLENDNLTCSYIINAYRLQNVDAIHFIAVLDEFGGTLTEKHINVKTGF